MIDNTVDSSTGTVKLKAEFPNPNLQLWPGQFVNVRLLIDTLKNVVVVPPPPCSAGRTAPSSMWSAGQQGHACTWSRCEKQDEHQAVIASGVEPPARVVTTGFVQLTDGKHGEGRQRRGREAARGKAARGKTERGNARHQPGADGRRGRGG